MHLNRSHPPQPNTATEEFKHSQLKIDQDQFGKKKKEGK